MSRFVDLNHVLEHGLVTYPGLPPLELSDFLSRADSRAIYAEGAEFHIGQVHMVANTGTYLDAPSHRFEDGADLAGLALESIADLPGVVVRMPAGSRPAISEAPFLGSSIEGRAVLIHTGWSRHFGTPMYGEGHPFLTEAGAAYLRDRRPALVGIDSLNIDDTTDMRRPAHTLLLEAGIGVVEHLAQLEKLPLEGFRFFCVPPRIRGLGSFPTRAFAILEG